MLRILLDTNIFIYKHSNTSWNKNIGRLFRYLNGHTKLIHYKSIEEMKKYKDNHWQELLHIYLEEYEIIEYDSKIDDLINNKIFINNGNDKIDIILLNEVFLGKVDYLITEDKQILENSKKIITSKKVLSINDAILFFENDKPTFDYYKNTIIERVQFGAINIDNEQIFDSLKENYYVNEKNNFKKWFLKHSTDYCYIHKNIDGKIDAFLYLKLETDKTDNYSQISRYLSKNKCRRVKIGTFKTLYSGGWNFGEALLKIAFDYAKENKVDEIYLTFFKNKIPKYDPTYKEGIKRLTDLVEKWGFQEKEILSNDESLYVKKLNEYKIDKDIFYNFPNLKYSTNYFYLIIDSIHHKKIFPDFWIKNEDNDSYIPASFSMEKIYITNKNLNDNRIGDIFIIYRKAEENTKKFKRYASVITGICILAEYKSKNTFKNFENFKGYVKNKSVYSENDLKNVYFSKKPFTVLKLIQYKRLKVKIPLIKLYSNDLWPKNNEHPQFYKISKENFNKILNLSKTSLS